MSQPQETIVISQSFKAGSTCVVIDSSTDEKAVTLGGIAVVNAAINFFRAAHDKFEFNGAGTTLYSREVKQAVLAFLSSGEQEGRIKDAMYDTTGHPHFFDLRLERVAMVSGE